MVSGMQMVAMGNLGMMTCLFMATADVMLGRFFVVAGCMLNAPPLSYDVLRLLGS